MLYDGGRGGKSLVRRSGRQYDEINIARRHVSCVKRPARCFNRKAGCCFIGLGNMAEFYTRPLCNPFVGRIDPAGQFSVGYAVAWKRRPSAFDNGTKGDVSHFGCIRARSCVMRAVMSSSTNRAATSTAWATPLLLAPPWLLTTTPFSPKNTAPL